MLGDDASSGTLISFDGAIDAVDCASDPDTVAIVDPEELGHAGNCTLIVSASGTYTIDGASTAVLLGTGAPDTLDGADAVNDNLVIGGPGNDTLSSSQVAVILGGSGKDVMTGGAGSQRFVDDDGKKGDKISAGEGRDAVFAADGAAGRIDCGGGFDTAYADKSDTIKNCETVIRVITIDS